MTKPMSTTPVHKWRSVRLEILAMYLRAGDDVVGDVQSKIRNVRGWLDARRLEALSDKEIDEGWTEKLEELEAERLRTLNELLKIRRVAAQVADDLPRGQKIVAVLLNIRRSLEDFCPQAYTQQSIAGPSTTVLIAFNRWHRSLFLMVASSLPTFLTRIVATSEVFSSLPGLSGHVPDKSGPGNP